MATPTRSKLYSLSFKTSKNKRLAYNKKTVEVKTYGLVEAELRKKSG